LFSLSSELWAGWAQASWRLRGLLADDDGLRLGGLASIGSLLLSGGGRLGYDLPLSELLTVGASYLLAFDRYRGAGTPSVLRHSVGASADLRFGRHLMFATEAVATLSEEERVLVLLATVAAYL
jgi:hypothetical protein